MRKLVLSLSTVFSLLATPAIAEESCQLVRYGVVPFQTDGTIHIYLPAVIAGRQTRIMMDTGAYWSILSDAFARTANLKIGRSLTFDMYDAAGDKMTTTTVTDLKIGNLNTIQAEFFIGKLPTDSPEDEAGLLGQNFLNLVDVEIDNAARTVSFFSSDHCKGAGVYWANEAVTLPYRKPPKQAPIGTLFKKSMPNELNLPIVAAELEGEVVPVLFDTGATFSVMDLELAKRKFGLSPDSPGVTPAEEAYTANGNVMQSYKYTFKSLVIAGIRFENVPVRLSKLDGGSQMLLGMNELKYLRIYFAPKDGLIHITAADAGR